MWLRRSSESPAGMAYRQRWWSRRRRWWAPRTYNRRYRRSHYGFRRRQRKYPKRRQHRVRKTNPYRGKKEVVTQWGPGNVRKCFIYGWFPVVCCTYDKRTRQWDLDNEKDYKGGGLHTIRFSLSMLYQLHKRHMNWWSMTNDGTDLCRYRGTKLKFWPNDKYSYIITWDRDFYKQEKFPIYLMHPMLLMLNPQHTTVFSLAIKGNRKPKSVWLPPPAVMTNEWYFQKHFAEYGIFELHATLFDPENPFTTDQQQNYRTTLGITVTDSGTVPPELQDLAPVSYTIFWDDCENNKMAFNTAGTNPKNTTEYLPPGYDNNYYKWIYWGNDYPYYVGIWGVDFDKISDQWGKNIWIWWYPGTSKTDPTPNFKHRKMWIPLNKDQAKALQYSGPFVQKQNEFNANLFLQYKSYWNFGGFTPDWTARHNDDPAVPEYDPQPGPTITSQKPYQVQIRDPKTVGEGVLHPWDIKEGLIKKELIKAWSATPKTSETAITGHVSTKNAPKHFERELSSVSSSDESEEEEILPEETLQKIHQLMGKLLRAKRH
ncbi:ORF1 [Anelloviridae sp.]|nr:ORF1 [Anelloviridae sp.]